MSAYLNTTSIENIIQTFTPLVAYFSLNNRTFDVNITESGYLYSFELDKIHVIQATGFTEKIFQNVPGTSMIHCKIGGIDVQTEIDADFKALHFIPFRASQLNITGLSVEFFIESVADSDDVHFKLVENSSVTITGLQIKMKNKILDELVYLSRGLINKVVNRMLPKIGKAIDEEVA